MQSVSGKVEFKACQVSLLRHNSFLVSLWTFQPTLAYVAYKPDMVWVYVTLCESGSSVEILPHVSHQFLLHASVLRLRPQLDRDLVRRRVVVRESEVLVSDDRLAVFLEVEWERDVPGEKRAHGVGEYDLDRWCERCRVRAVGHGYLKRIFSSGSIIVDVECSNRNYLIVGERRTWYLTKKRYFIIPSTVIFEYDLDI